ncbi:MAG: carboxypeptidase regulatory-like domain-containing protein [Fibrobacter sp.]|nr:carboxypeptidase regulatory-like domain-containing protein [Fibrobacter sp.]
MRSSLLALPILASAVIMATVFGCSSPDSNDGVHITGTATDTENTVVASTSFVGSVKRSDGKAATNVVVRMAKMSQETAERAIPTYVEIETDSVGEFSVDSLVADSFQIAVIDTVVNEIYFQPKATVKDSTFEPIKLAKASVVNSKLLYQESSEPEVAVGSHFLAFVPGTPISRSVFAGDSFSMLIPAGKVKLAFCPGDPQIVAKLSERGIADSLIFRDWQMPKVSVKEGESVDVGPFLWSISPNIPVDTLIKERENSGRISGKVNCKNGKACAGVEVQLVTDLYGFNFTEGDSLVFKAETQTDSAGRWYLPIPPEFPYDSFRVEYRRLDSSLVSEVGVSKYISVKEIKNKKDTVNVGTVTLHRPSKLNSSVRVVLDSLVEGASDNCMVNSVVLGIKGTTHFVRDITCNLITMSDLPGGDQDLVLYTGDPKVVSTLRNMETPMSEFVSQVDINLPEGWYLDQQGMTYTPPAIK